MPTDPVIAGQIALAAMILPMAGLLAAVLVPLVFKAWDATMGAFFEARAATRIRQLQQMREECRMPKARITRICGHATECHIFGTDACGLTKAA